MLGATDRNKRLVRDRADHSASSAAAERGLVPVIGFGSNPGNLAMFRYVPDDLPASAPLVVVLHGCGQSAADHDRGAGWTELADLWGFAVLLPEQRRDNNRQGCFNWFSPKDIERGHGEALSIRQMVEWMHLEYGTDPRRTYITGLSAGGALAVVMMACYPELFAAGAVVAGVPYKAATSLPGALDTMFRGRTNPAPLWGDLVRAASGHDGPWPRLSIWHGSADSVVRPTNAVELARQWCDLHGIDDRDFEQDLVDGHGRRVYRDQHGEPLIELFAVAGLNHGTPIDAEQGGLIGPFALEAGISSTRRIAEFWGLDRPRPLPQYREKEDTTAIEPPVIKPPVAPTASPEPLVLPETVRTRDDTMPEQRDDRRPGLMRRLVNAIKNVFSR